jgi:tetratricopeptide (TPR) repeat protein
MNTASHLPSAPAPVLDIEEALKALDGGEQRMQEMQRIDHDDLILLYQRGKEAYEAGLLERASNDFRKLVVNRPWEPKFHIALAQTLMRREQFEEALDYFMLAFLLAPADTSSLFSIAQCCRALNIPHIARDALMAILELQAVVPDFSDAEKANAMLVELN